MTGPDFSYRIDHAAYYQRRGQEYGDKAIALKHTEGRAGILDITNPKPVAQYRYGFPELQICSDRIFS